MKKIIAICLLLCVTLLSGCSSEPEAVVETVCVISGGKTIEAKPFLAWVESEEESADSLGYSEIFGYTEEELAGIPTLTREIAISVGLSEGAKYTSIVNMSLINLEEQYIDFCSSEDIAALESGEYYFMVETISVFSDDHSRGYDHVFKLIVE